MKSTTLHKKTAKELCRELCSGMTELLDKGPSYGGFVAMQDATVKRVVRQSWPKISAKSLSRIAARMPVVTGYQKPGVADARRIEEVLVAEITAPEPTLAPKAKPSAVKRK